MKIKVLLYLLPVLFLSFYVNAEKINLKEPEYKKSKKKIYEYEGSVYTGEKKNGIPHGKGKLVNKKYGAVYEGDWKDGMRHGKGKMKYPDGNTYEGDFKNDVRSGKGVSIGANGDKYTGEFSDDTLHGKGTYI